MIAVGERQGSIAVVTIVACAGIVVLIGLGIWQLERKTWKEGLITELTARLAAAPVNLPAHERWASLDRDRDEFRRMTFPAEYVAGQYALVYASAAALRPDVSGPGYWVMSPARLAGGSIVVINRGYIPADRVAAGQSPPDAPGGVIDMTGTMRWPDERGMFTPDDDVKKNIWHLRDPKSIADAKGWGHVAPFYTELEAPSPPGGLPRPGPLVVKLVNNHLQYALTWFGLAAGLAGVYLVWLRGRLRRA